MATTKGKGRGFAAMSPEKKRSIASKGGKAAHEQGTAYHWTSGADGTAAKAGRVGGKISRKTKPDGPHTRRNVA